jgi:hypothetical protein
MATVTECIEKLVVAGQVTRKVSDCFTDGPIESGQFSTANALPLLRSAIGSPTMTARTRKPNDQVSEQRTDLGGHETMATEVAITPGMILAGQACFARLAGEVSSDYLVEQVFQAMWSAHGNHPIS